MEKTIEVLTTTGESRTVTAAEAEKIIRETYDDRIGGLVVNMATHEVIWSISPGVEKIMIVQMLGGG